MLAVMLSGFQVLLVDDHALFREGLGLALTRQAPGLQLQAVADVPHAIERLRADAHATDLVLLDYRLPGEDGLLGARRIRTLFPHVACALISGADDPQLLQRARAEGLMGYFPKTLDVAALVAGLEKLAQGEPSFVAHGAQRPHPGLAALTARQQEVLAMVAAGASNKEIAQVMQIAPHTVKNHLAQIFERLGAANRVQAAAIAQGDRFVS